MDRVEGAGATTTRELSIAAFTGIDAASSIDVEVTRGDSQHVEVTAQPNLIDLLNVDVSGGTWKIRTKKGFRTREAFIVRITTPGLELAHLSGSGDVHAENVFADGADLAVEGSGSLTATGINGPKVKANVDGSGDLNLKGTCSELNAHIDGSGNLRAQGLAANSVNVRVEGSGDAEVTAISELDARIEGSGNVRYAGKPKVESKVQGSGAVVPIP